MANTSYTKKIIELRITLGKGSFAGGGNTKIISGLGVEANVEKPGLPDKNKARVKIYNMKLEDIEQLTTLAFRPLQARRNTLTILAGDKEKGLTQVFAGEITSAYGDFNSAPDIAFVAEAMSGYYGALTPASPTTIKGATPLAGIMDSLAQGMGYTFKNEGVTASLRNPVLNGSPMQQAEAAAKQAGINLVLDDNVMTILPANAASSGNAVLLNKTTGMIGYPTFNSDGIVVKSLFNPALRFNGLIKVESIVPKASGVWRVVKLVHKLEAFVTKDGAWFSEIEAAYTRGA